MFQSQYYEKKLKFSQIKTLFAVLVSSINVQMLIFWMSCEIYEMALFFGVGGSNRDIYRRYLPSLFIFMALEEVSLPSLVSNRVQAPRPYSTQPC